MSDADSKDMSTIELTAQVLALNEKLTRQADERHKLNTAMSTTMLNVGNQLMQTEQTLAKLGGDVAKSVALVEKLSDRLLGNETMQTVGLVQEVSAIRTDVDALKNDRMRVVTIATTVSFIVGLLAAIGGWVASHWPWGGHKGP